MKKSNARLPLDLFLGVFNESASHLRARKKYDKRTGEKGISCVSETEMLTEMIYHRKISYAGVFVFAFKSHTLPSFCTDTDWQVAGADSTDCLRCQSASHSSHSKWQSGCESGE